MTNLRLFDHMTPLFNLIVSNVPGPDFPLYLAGARMVAMYPVGPIIEGVGVNITVFTYLDTMYVGIQGCWDLVPDIEVIARGHGAVPWPSWSPRPVAGTDRCPEVARGTPCVGGVWRKGSRRPWMALVMYDVARRWAPSVATPSPCPRAERVASEAGMVCC